VIADAAHALNSDADTGKFRAAELEFDRGLDA